MSKHPTPLVRRSGNRLITTSLAISQHFEKKHMHVMEAIRNLDCSREFNGSNFRLITYTDGRQRQKPAYEITRDGFVFLCMGFTGHTAARWKERYIAAFNRMEEALRKQQGSNLPAPLISSHGARVVITREMECYIMRLFVAGHSYTSINRHLFSLGSKVSNTAISQILHGKYRFSPEAGEDMTTPELLDAVAQRHMNMERYRINLKYNASAANKQLEHKLEKIALPFLQSTATEVRHV